MLWWELHVTLKHPSRRDFILRVSSVSAVLAAGGALSSCGDGSDPVIQFNHGVASGDPLADRVILWTHARTDSEDEDVALTYELSADPSFLELSSSGSVTASAANGHTAKIDVVGLAANTEYYFRFRAGKTISPVGRTRTLPLGAVEEVKLAVLSCANFPAGYFNVYAEAARSDAQFAIHLGDFIYEYGADGYASAQAEGLGRTSEPANEILTLEDYRRRYQQYRSDVDLRTLLARMPMIAVWDDHEIANNSWKDGAENHTEGAEGSFAARRTTAIRAWHEWMPVRTEADPARIYRSFDFGNLLSLHMLDTRSIGRDQQIDVRSLLNPATASATKSALLSPDRQLLGPVQENWLQQQVAASRATWQVLGQQVLMARMEFPVSVLAALNPTDTSPAAVAAGQKAISDYLAAKATPAEQRSLEQRAALDTTLNPKLGYNLDAWDGYPFAREVLLASIAAMRKKLVVLAGDTHNAWHSDLTLTGLLNPAQADVKVGEEFATPSVTSPGFEAYLPIGSSEVKAVFEGVVESLNWIDPSRRGFLKMTFTPSQAKGEFIFLNTVATRRYEVAAPVPGEARTFDDGTPATVAGFGLPAFMEPAIAAG
jgi:alkaline phosphatase D